MGEREVTEYIEVTENEKVHLCDFCGRDSDTFDGTFNDVFINSETEALLLSHNFGSYTVTQSTEHRSVRGKFIREDELITESDQELHLCNECYNAYMGALE